jgi:putative toxin-antitoxin system antitoxin component (TIGR02293 family)
MTYLEMSFDKIMKHRKGPQKPSQTKHTKVKKSNGSNIVAEPEASYRRTTDRPVVFKIVRGGKQREYAVESGFGYFIGSFRKATHITQISEVVDKGIASKEIKPVIQYLGFKVPEIAKAAAVSPSTVNRWEPETSIGVAGTNQFFKIDEIIKKGVDLFGGPDEFKAWLDSPNLALGNQVPGKILTSQIGVELVDEALDALHFGTVM